MKKLFASLVIFQFTFNLFGQIQSSIPEAPKKIEFANVLVELNTESQKLVNDEIAKILTPQNKFLEQKLERIQWYFPIIERILDEEDVPQDFKYLAVMESSLLPDAISSSNAVGYWQFKDATGKEVGLRIDNSIDERKNIQESTRAAALYLKRNNLIYKNWVSCILTYNQGVSGAAENIPPDWSFASEIKFNGNTHPYLIKALAHRIAIEYRINRLKDSSKKFIEYPTRGKSLAEIALELGVDINELRNYNSWLYSPSLPTDKTYSVLILSRVEDSEGILSKIQKRVDIRALDVGFPQLKRVTMVSTSPDSPIFYEINGKKGILAQPGNEVAQMATKSKVKISSFLKYNDMSDKDIAKEGLVYYLQKKNKKANVAYHTVMGDQSLWDVSQMYGVRLKFLQKYNRMDNVARLQLGRVLWLQKTRPKRTPIEIIKEVIPATPSTPYTPSTEVVEKPSLPVRDNYSTDDISSKAPPVNKPIENVIPKEKPVAASPSKTFEPVKEVIRDQPLTKDDPVFSGNKKVPTNTPSSKEPTPTVSDSKKIHIVKQGETLYSISRKYNLSVGDIRKLNNLGPNDPLLYNQELIVSNVQFNSKPNNPTRETVVVSAPSKVYEKPRSILAKNHIVSSGETLYSISKIYDIEVSDLKSWNNLTDNSISIGQELQVSISNASSNPINKQTNINSASTSTHKVESGETLYSISRKYNVSVADIKVWNNLNDNSISVGQNIKIRK